MLGENILLRIPWYGKIMDQLQNRNFSNDPFKIIGQNTHKSSFFMFLHVLEVSVSNEKQKVEVVWQNVVARFAPEMS